MIKSKQHLLTGLFVLFLAVSALACGGQNPTVENTKAAKLDIELNEGEKWIANAETTQGIEKMKSIVNRFEFKAGTKAYSKLSEELENEFTIIFQKCTMKGEAHNQLHNYLIPLKDYIVELSSDEPVVAQNGFEKILPHLAAYPNYFQ